MESADRRRVVSHCSRSMGRSTSGRVGRSLNTPWHFCVRQTIARRREMKTIITASAIVGALMLAAPAANAKGCVKGAVVGGVAGHYVGSGHGVLGAAAGCLVGRHYGKKHAREQQIRQNTARTY